MAYKYETSKETVLKALVIYAYQDREAMLGSLMSGITSGDTNDLDPDDKEYHDEITVLCRDIIRFAHNNNLGHFHESVVKDLSKPTGQK